MKRKLHNLATSSTFFILACRWLKNSISICFDSEVLYSERVNPCLYAIFKAKYISKLEDVFKEENDLKKNAENKSK